MLDIGDIAIDIQLRHPRQPSLLRVTAILYDLTLLHELSVLLTDPEFRGYSFDQFFWRRNGRPLDEDQRLIVDSLVVESPLKLGAGLKHSVTMIGALWVFVQGIEKVSTIDLQRQKVRAEIEYTLAETEKIHLESAEIRRRFASSDYVLDSLAAHQGPAAQETLQRLTNRLKAQELQVDALRVRPYKP
jgi:hypothetical protein